MYSHSLVRCVLFGRLTASHCEAFPVDGPPIMLVLLERDSSKPSLLCTGNKRWYQQVN
jgi:hypothetical protein